MVIDWIELSKAVPYAAIAIIFGLFMERVLKLVGEQREAEMTRMTQRDEKLAERQHARDKERDSQFIASITQRDKDWQTFMALQQEARALQWSDVIAELRALSAQSILVADLLRAHDAWERGLMAIVSDETRKGPQGGRNE